MVDGVRLIPLRRFEDERGWFFEVRRERAAEADAADEHLLLAPGRDPRPPLPRAGPGRPLRLPRGNGPRGRARPRDRRDVHRGHRRREPVAVYIPGHHAHGFEALTDRLFCYHVTEEYDPDRPRRAGRLLGRSSREAPLEHRAADPVRARSRGVLVTGGQRTARRRSLGGAFRRRTPHERRVQRGGAASARERLPTSSCTRRPGPNVDGAESGGAGAGRQRARHAQRGRAQRTGRLLLDRLRLRRLETRALRRVGPAQPALAPTGRIRSLAASARCARAGS